MTFDFYGNKIDFFLKRFVFFVVVLGPWDDRTGVSAPLFHQHYQAESESLRNVVSNK